MTSSPSDVIASLLSQVGDESLRAALTREVELLRGSRRFGLVFDRQLPEATRLPQHPVRVGDHVVARDESSPQIYRVFGFTDRTRKVATVLPVDADRRTAGEPQECPVAALVVIRNFGEPIHPGLGLVERINGNPEAPWHTVIEGENLHALQVLDATHRGKVDVIYIDPPYNTGNKSWIYNDRYVDDADRSKSSKWLSFMERRLIAARDLLKRSGVIFVSIDDNEQHRLRMLMDQVFDPGNFVDTLAVEMSTTSGPKTTNAQQGTIVKNVEYVHIYRAGPDFDTIRHTPLFDGERELWDTHYGLWLNDDGTIDSFTKRLSEDGTVQKDIARFGLTDDKGKFLGQRAMTKLLTVSEAANKFVLDNLDRIARKDSPPVSCKDKDAPLNGWVEVEADHRTYLITKTSTGKINQIYPLSRNFRKSDDYEARFGRTVIRGDLWKGFHQDMGNVAKEGGVPFNNGKKPIRLIKQLIRWANNSPDAVILDFFGGSGSTAHAVMDMNAEDGGQRQVVLVTNNEMNHKDAQALRRDGYHPGDPEFEAKGVFRSVTMPRVKNVISSGVQANVSFYSLAYLDEGMVRKGREFTAIAPMLHLQAGGTGPCIDSITDAGFEVTETYGVLFSADARTKFVANVHASGARVVFIVTNSVELFAAIREQLPGVESHRLYESYLRNFEVNTLTGKATL